jgi:succinate dehydrogenase / fumarate reductase cytochrome b subunit
MIARTETISNFFLWRRIHSLMGLWLVIFLIEHLIVNSQAALWLGDDGIGFVRLANLLESLPFLQVFEVILIGVPIAVHGIWGVRRALMAKTNVQKSNGGAPSLPFERNRAFRWQRLTSWILLFGILGHVVQMRFLDYPKKLSPTSYQVTVADDPAMESLSQRLGIAVVKEGDHVIATAETPGKAMLLTVRDTFKSPTYCILYTIFVLAAAFHAFNGFWTSLITWGVMLSSRSQRAVLPICWVGVALLAFLGLAAIWGSYWLNLQN